MKKILLIGFAIVLIAAFAWFSLLYAATIDVPGQKGDTIFGPVTLTSLQYATGYGTNVYALPTFMKSFTWTTVIASGYVTSVTSYMYGSGDGVTYGILDTASSASGDMLHVANKPVRYLKSYIGYIISPGAGVTIKAWGTVY